MDTDDAAFLKLKNMFKIIKIETKKPGNAAAVSTVFLFHAVPLKNLYNRAEK